MVVVCLFLGWIEDFMLLFIMLDMESIELFCGYVEDFMSLVDDDL